jgi:hypothetical protein
MRAVAFAGALASLSFVAPYGRSGTPATDAVVSARDLPGPSVADRIVAAISALPPSGGTVDATSFTGTERLTRTIAVGSRTKRVVLRLGSITFVGTDTLFELFDGARLVGNGHTLLTQANGANLGALVVGRRIADCEIASLTIDGNRAGNSGPGRAIARPSV